MRKLFIIITILLIGLTSYSQDVIGTRIIAKQSLFLRDRWLDSVLVDTSLFQGSNRSVPTAGAVYDFVTNRGGGGSGSGTVTSVGWIGGIVSIANPTTTPAFTIAGTSGGIPYFSSSSTWATSAALAANSLIIGGGAGSAPSSTTTGTGVLTALGINVGSAGAFVTFNGAGGTPSSMVGTNITGTASGLSIGGNAATATILQTARNIQGVSFNGSANIDIINGTGFVKATGTTLSYDNSTYVTSNIYTADGTLPGARAVALNGNTLSINQGANSFLSIDPTAGAEISFLRAYNTTNDDNYAKFEGTTANTGSSFNIESSFNGGEIETQISSTTASGISNIGYSALTHEFTGNVGIGVSPTVLFQVQSGGNDWLSIDPTPGIESSLLQAYNITGTDNIGFLRAFAVDDESEVRMSASYQDGTAIALIIGDANAEGGHLVLTATTAIEYSAPIHTFTGNILTATNNTYDIGDATNSFKDIYGKSLLLDGSTSGTVTLASDALGNTPTGTTLTGAGTIETYSSSRLRSDHTLANSNTVQAVFPSGQDVFTLQPNTTYDFEGVYMFTHGSTSHNIALSFPTGGAGSIATINYNTVTWTSAIGTQTATQATNMITTTAATVVVGGAAVAQESVFFSGTFTTGSGGTVTVTPSITFSADPTGTVLTKTDSRIKITPVGTDVFATQGPVN